MEKRPSRPTTHGLALLGLTLLVALFAIGCGGGSAIEQAATKQYHAKSAACENEGAAPDDSGDIYGCRLVGGFRDGERFCAQFTDGTIDDVTSLLQFAEDQSGEQPFACAR